MGADAFPLANSWYPQKKKKRKRKYRGETEYIMHRCKVVANLALRPCLQGDWDAIHMKDPIQPGGGDLVHGR